MTKYLLLRRTKYDNHWEPIQWADWPDELDKFIYRRREHSADETYRIVVVDVRMETAGDWQDRTVDPLDTDPDDILRDTIGKALDDAEKVLAES